MSVSSSSDVVPSNKTPKELIGLIDKNHIDLNDVLADLKHLSTVLNNLTVAVSLYLADKGELDPKRFKIVSNTDQDQQTPQSQPITDNRKEDPS